MGTYNANPRAKKLKAASIRKVVPLNELSTVSENTEFTTNGFTNLDILFSKP